MSALAFCYDDGKVTVPRFVRPYDVLGVKSSATLAETKAAFRKIINRRKRQDRAMGSLAYHMLTSKLPRYRKIEDSRGPVYEIARSPDPFVLACVGDKAQLLAKVLQNKCVLTDRDEHGRTVLYLAARAGFYDITKALLEKGSMDKTQEDGSTPLHAASFYGHRHIVKLLLEYGADPELKNRWNNTPGDEAASTEIKRDFLVFKNDQISELEILLLKHGHGLAESIHLIEDDDKIVGKAILRSERALVEDPKTHEKWDYIRSNWETAWHGTKYNYLASILEHGLLPSGSKTPDGTHIKPPDNHFGLNEEIFGNPTWAHAIFVSPNILYAQHDCYSGRVFSEEAQWCVLVKVCVEPGSYEAFQSTVHKQMPIDGEPERPEYRIAVPEEHDVFHRIESARHVVVTSIVFIRIEFLCTISHSTHTFAELNSLFKW